MGFKSQSRYNLIAMFVIVALHTVFCVIFDWVYFSDINNNVISVVVAVFPSARLTVNFYSTSMCIYRIEIASMRQAICVNSK